MADVLRQFKIVEPHAQHILAGQHAQQQEQEQGGYTITGTDLRHQDGGEDQDGTQQEQVIRQQVHGEEGGRHHWISNRFRNPVIMNTLRRLSLMFCRITFPPCSAVSFRRTRNRRSPELEM